MMMVLIHIIIVSMIPSGCFFLHVSWWWQLYKEEDVDFDIDRQYFLFFHHGNNRKVLGFLPLNASKWHVFFRSSWAGTKKKETAHLKIALPWTSGAFWFTPPKFNILLMEEILHHLGCTKPCKQWDKLPTSTGAEFLPSTVAPKDWWFGRRSFPFGSKPIFRGEMLNLRGFTSSSYTQVVQ